MSKRKYHLTADRVRDVLSYDPDTGQFIWTQDIGKRRGMKGTRAGYQDDLGYIHIRVGGLYLAHRLAWLYMTREWPKGNIDHINGHPTDNRWENLRECNQSQNGANSKKVRCNSSTRTGVAYDKCRNKYRAYINQNRKQINVGRFDTEEEAILAREAAERRVFGDFRRR